MIQTFTNLTTITIGDSGSPPTAASPYPSDIVVSGMPTYTQKITIALDGVTHTSIGCVDMLLVGPTGFVVVIWSRVAVLGSAITDLMITLDDQGVDGLMPDLTTLMSGTYIPTPYEIIAPADFPGGPAAVPPPTLPDDAYLYTGLDAFIGLDPNGTWSLYVVNECIGDTGQITSGWSITVDSI